MDAYSLLRRIILNTLWRQFYCSDIDLHNSIALTYIPIVNSPSGNRKTYQVNLEFEQHKGLGISPKCIWSPKYDAGFIFAGFIFAGQMK